MYEATTVPREVIATPNVSLIDGQATDSTPVGIPNPIIASVARAIKILKLNCDPWVAKGLQRNRYTLDIVTNQLATTTVKVSLVGAFG